MHRPQFSQSLGNMAILHEVNELRPEMVVEKATDQALDKKAAGKTKSLNKRKGIAASGQLLKSLGNEKRLAILYLLQEAEYSVLDIASALRLRQPTVSQQLARLRADRLVRTRRDGQTIYYSLACEKTASLLDLLGELHGK